MYICCCCEGSDDNSVYLKKQRAVVINDVFIHNEVHTFSPVLMTKLALVTRAGRQLVFIME